MNFTYPITGKLRTRSCFALATTITIRYRYAIGQIVYDCKKAKKGVLEAYAIKDVLLFNNKKTYGKTVPLYIDTLNAYHNEWDLCSQEDAVNHAIAYWEDRIAEIDSYLENYVCQ